MEYGDSSCSPLGGFNDEIIADSTNWWDWWRLYWRDEMFARLKDIEKDPHPNGLSLRRHWGGVRARRSNRGAPDRTRKNDALKRSERDNQPAREGRGLYPKTESKLGSWKNRVEISFSTRFDKYKSTIVKISKYYPYQKWSSSALSLRTERRNVRHSNKLNPFYEWKTLP